MILSYEQIKAIQSQIELQRGQAVINGNENAGDIGFQVDVNPAHDHHQWMDLKVDVSGGTAFRVDIRGKVAY